MDRLKSYRRRDARIGVAIPKELRVELEGAAAVESVNISVIVRAAITEYLNKPRRKHEKKS